MGELKPGWKRVKFGDVVRLVKGTCKDPVAAGIDRVIGLEHLEPGDLRVRSWADVAEGTTFTSRVRPGQVLFGKRRAYQRKVAVAEFDAVCSGDIYVFESADPERLLPELLPFICQTDAFFDHAVGTSAGSLSPRTNWTSLAAYELALPPLDEQRRIAEASQLCTQLREALLKAHDAAVTAADSLCEYAVTSTPITEQVEVGTLAKFTSGKSIAVTTLPQKPTGEALIPVYGGNGVAGFTHHAMAGLSEATVVVGRVGQFCGATRLTSGPSWVTDNALYPTSVDGRLDLAFLALALRGRRLNRGKLGEYLPLITQKVIHSSLIPLPSLEEQGRLVSGLREIELSAERLLERVRATKALLENIWSSLSGDIGDDHVVH